MTATNLVIQLAENRYTYLALKTTYAPVAVNTLIFFAPVKHFVTMANATVSPIKTYILFLMTLHEY